MAEWRELVSRRRGQNHKGNHRIVGKYVDLPGAYLSIVEALKHAGFQYNAHIDIRWTNAEKVGGKGDGPKPCWQE